MLGMAIAKTSRRTWRGLGCALIAGFLSAASISATSADNELPAASTGRTETSAPRPRIGLVLSGGGARGLAHVGVLKVLERERIPIHAITGTSMGAIIGGLFASGMSARDLERELLALNWDEVFAPRVPRQQLSQRRKEEDFELSPVLEFGMRDANYRRHSARSQGVVSNPCCVGSPFLSGRSRISTHCRSRFAHLQPTWSRVSRSCSAPVTTPNRCAPR